MIVFGIVIYYIYSSTAGLRSIVGTIANSPIIDQLNPISNLKKLNKVGEYTKLSPNEKLLKAAKEHAFGRLIKMGSWCGEAPKAPRSTACYMIKWKNAAKCGNDYNMEAKWQTQDMTHNDKLRWAQHTPLSEVIKDMKDPKYCS